MFGWEQHSLMPCQKRGIESVKLPEKNRSHIVSVPLGDKSADKVLSILNDQSVVGALRNQHLRLAPHFYNNESDVEQCAEAVAQALI